jgi:hypothetical protein
MLRAALGTFGYGFLIEHGEQTTSLLPSRCVWQQFGDATLKAISEEK